MMRFAFITSLDELEKIYSTNKTEVIYQVSKEDFDQLKEDTDVILGHCRLGTIYAKVKRKSVQPRHMFKVDDVTYFVVFEILVEHRLELGKPFSEWDFGRSKLDE